MSPQVAVALDDVPNPGAVRVMLDGVAVAVVRDAHGEVHAIADTCSHADVSLAEGEVEDCSIECWLHGSRFDLRTGKPLALPAIRPVAVYPVSLEAGQVLVDVSAPLVLEES
ncbi:MAG: non-heme iron oxygenase ferredoxin subunit [Kineosporiaceae bacterium]|nr:non-heme iron oxygenase ferredoxin subunit [Kineosporiaceae bacterium]MBK7624945.1 non-heme iron oxygenase ferredoxin subunit [Kineosporiaceae bacterium]MBK8076676.1 non-heme iron oxygenase ferredoxin subunit [Kineosporiaceae bacterium]